MMMMMPICILNQHALGDLYSASSLKQSTCTYIAQGPRVAQWVRSLDLTTHTSLSPIRHGFALNFVNYKKGCTRLAAVSDKVYQLLAQGRWLSPGTPASSTTKAGRHDIAEILLKVALNTKIQIHISLPFDTLYWFRANQFLFLIINVAHFIL